MSNPQEQNKSTEETHIVVKIKTLEEDDEIFFRMNKSKKLNNLMYAYCDRRGLKLDAFTFMFDGRRLQFSQTPDEVDMKDGDEIHAMRPLGGGLRADQRQWSYMVFDKIDKFL